MSRIDDPSIQQGNAGEQTQQRDVGQQLRDVGSQVRDAAQQQYTQLRDSANEYYQQGRERAMEWEQNFEDYVREQPMKSVLIAAGIGCIIGFLWRRS